MKSLTFLLMLVAFSLQAQIVHMKPLSIEIYSMKYDMEDNITIELTDSMVLSVYKDRILQLSCIVEFEKDKIGEDQCLVSIKNNVVIIKPDDYIEIRGNNTRNRYCFK